MLSRALTSSSTRLRCNPPLLHYYDHTATVLLSRPCRFSYRSPSRSLSTRQDEASPSVDGASKADVPPESDRQVKRWYRQTQKGKKSSSRVPIHEPLAALDDTTTKRGSKPKPNATLNNSDRSLSNDEAEEPDKGVLVLRRAPKIRKSRGIRKAEATTEDVLESSQLAQPSPRPRREKSSIDSLLQEKSTLDWSEVKNNIEELRPDTQGSPIPLQELYKLEEKLTDGFTKSQLSMYLSASSKQHPSKATNPRKEKISVYPWTGNSLSTDDSSNTHPARDLLGGYRTPSHTSKQIMALAIIRRCWQVEGTEVVESIGQIQMKLPIAMIETLIKGQNSVLKQLANIHLDTEGEKIEVVRSEMLITIHAKKLKAELLVSKIRNILHHFEQKTVYIPDILAAKGKSSDLSLLSRASSTREIGRLTGTDIQRDESNLVISYLNRHRDSKLSTRADIAVRLWLMATGLYNRHDRRVLSHESVALDQGSEPALQWYAMKPGDKIPWLQRTKTWGRWAGEVNSPKSEGSKQSTLDSDQHKTRSSRRSDLLLSLNGSVLETSAEGGVTSPTEQASLPTSVEGWSSEKLADTFAVVGHVLYELPKDKKLTGKWSDVQRMESRSHFVPTSYGLSQMISAGHLTESEGHIRDTIHLHFEPTPWTDRAIEETQQFPGLELRLSVDGETGKPEIKDLLAVQKVRTIDILTPSMPIDVRFQQRSTWRLPWNEENQNRYPAILDFFEHSKLAVRKSKLQTPPNLTIGIPRFMTQLAGELNTLEVPYLFAGLEFHRTLALEWKGWQVRYTSIEGGPTTGTRGELRLVPKSDNMTDAERKEFVEAAYQLMDDLVSARTSVRNVPTDRSSTVE